MHIELYIFLSSMRVSGQIVLQQRLQIPHAFALTTITTFPFHVMAVLLSFQLQYLHSPTCPQTCLGNIFCK